MLNNLTIYTDDDAGMGHILVPVPNGDLAPMGDRCLRTKYSRALIFRMAKAGTFCAGDYSEDKGVVLCVITDKGDYVTVLDMDTNEQVPV
jgi:hypothetical protein